MNQRAMPQFPPAKRRIDRSPQWSTSRAGSTWTWREFRESDEKRADEGKP